MGNALKIGKYSLIGLIWFVAMLAWFDLISVLALIQFSLSLFWVIIAVTIGFALFNVVETPKSGVKFIIGLVSLAIILGITFMASDVELDSEGEVIEGSQLAEAGIYLLNILAISALVLIVLSEVKRVLKL